MADKGDKGGPSGHGGSGADGDGGASGAAPTTPQALLTAASAPPGSASMATAATAAAAAARAARTPARARRLVPDEPWDATEEPARKKHKVKTKRGAKGRRRRALRNTPSDVWAAIFKQLPDLEREIPKLRLVCRQFDDTVSGRVITHCRPTRGIRDAQLSSLLQRFPILQSLDASGCHGLSGAWLRDLEHHTTLRRLVLDRCMRLFPPRESSYWIYISSAERLEHLSVADNPHFGLEDLQLTYELENLRSLNLSGCSALTSDALLLFGQDPGFARTLTSLDLSGLPKLDDPCMAGLPGLSQLRTLSLAHCTGLTRDGLGFAAPLPNLTFLSIEGCGKMSTTGAALGLSALASLRCLDASWLGGELGPESDDEATQGALRAGNNGMGWAGWAECLAGCLTNLEELRVGGAAATDFDLMALRPLTRLTALDVCDSQDVTSDGLSALLALKQLARLNLEGCLGVGDEGVAHLAALPAIADLDLGACDEVSDQALESLAAATNLRVLNVVDCTVSDDGVAALKKALPGIAVSHTRAPEGYWEIVITDTEDEFDDLDGEEWEVMLMNAGEDSDNASGDEGGVGGAAAGANAAGEGAGADAAGGADGDAGGGAEEAALGQPVEGSDGGAPPCAAPADEGEPMDV